MASHDDFLTAKFERDKHRSIRHLLLTPNQSQSQPELSANKVPRNPIIVIVGIPCPWIHDCVRETWNSTKSRVEFGKDSGMQVHTGNSWYGHFLSTRNPFHECMSTTVYYTWSRIFYETGVLHAWASLLRCDSGLFFSRSTKLPVSTAVILFTTSEKFLLLQFGQLCVIFQVLSSSPFFPSCDSLLLPQPLETQHWLVPIPYWKGELKPGSFATSSSIS